MSTTSRNKNLIFIIAVLLLTNIAVLVYFLAWKKPGERMRGPDRKGGFVEILEKEVGFDETQVARYHSMKQEQREKVRPLYDEMRKAKDSLFRLMSDPTVTDSVISHAGDVIAQRQKALDLQTFQHFRRVRELCANPDQQVKYDSAILRMFRKMARPARKPDTLRQDQKPSH